MGYSHMRLFTPVTARCPESFLALCSSMVWPSMVSAETDTLLPVKGPIKPIESSAIFFSFRELSVSLIV
jgi:hypothetical protein